MRWATIDALDVFGVHCVGGILGALGTGILAAPSLGGTGVFDYTIGKVADYDMVAQVIVQAKTVCLTLVWSGVGTLIILSILRAVVGLRPPVPTRSAKTRTRRSRRAGLQLLIRSLRRASALHRSSAAASSTPSPVRAPMTPGAKTPGVFCDGLHRRVGKISSTVLMLER